MEIEFLDDGEGCGDPDCRCPEVVSMKGNVLTVRRGCASDEDSSQDG